MRNFCFRFFLVFLFSFVFVFTEVFTFRIVSVNTTITTLSIIRLCNTPKRLWIRARTCALFINLFIWNHATLFVQLDNQWYYYYYNYYFYYMHYTHTHLRRQMSLRILFWLLAPLPEIKRHYDHALPFTLYIAARKSYIHLYIDWSWTHFRLKCVTHTN